MKEDPRLPSPEEMSEQTLIDLVLESCLCVSDVCDDGSWQAATFGLKASVNAPPLGNGMHSTARTARTQKYGGALKNLNASLPGG